jgi:hypothetical protein
MDLSPNKVFTNTSPMGINLAQIHQLEQTPVTPISKENDFTRFLDNSVDTYIRYTSLVHDHNVTNKRDIRAKIPQYKTMIIRGVVHVLEDGIRHPSLLQFIDFITPNDPELVTAISQNTKAIDHFLQFYPTQLTDHSYDILSSGMIAYILPIFIPQFIPKFGLVTLTKIVVEHRWPDLVSIAFLLSTEQVVIIYLIALSQANYMAFLEQLIRIIPLTSIVTDHILHQLRHHGRNDDGVISWFIDHTPV